MVFAAATNSYFILDSFFSTTDYDNELDFLGVIAIITYLSFMAFPMVLANYISKS